MSFPLLLALLRGQRMTQLAFGAGFALYALIIMALFPSFSESNVYAQISEALPKELMAAFGIDMEILSSLATLTLPAFVAFEYFITWNLVVVIFAVSSGSGLIAREAERGTLELLLAHPIARNQVVLTKYCSFLLSLAGVGLISGLTLWAFTPLAREGLALGGLTATVLQGVLLSAAIGGLAILCSVLWLDPRRALAAAGAVTTALYLLNVAASTLDWLKWAQPYSLFHFFQPAQVMQSNRPDVAGLLACAAVASVAVGLAMLVLSQRQLIL